MTTSLFGMIDPPNLPGAQPRPWTGTGWRVARATGYAHRSAEVVSAGLSADQPAPDVAQSRISIHQGLAGAVPERVQSSQNVNSTHSVPQQPRSSDVSDIGPADVTVAAAQASYRVALATIGRVRQTSLLDFLR